MLGSKVSSVLVAIQLIAPPLFTKSIINLPPTKKIEDLKYPNCPGVRNGLVYTRGIEISNRLISIRAVVSF